tara:strand:+ start:531 stop:1094 length:564 start_codon:yes stop_codon:yes gene_type:complete
MNLCEQYSAEDKIYYFYLQKEVEQFFYHEAELIDTRQFKEWLELMHEDISYFMPMRKNVKFGQHAALENTRRGEEISWFDEDKWTLGKRVEQILTGVHYAEEPLSRVSHLVTNIQLTEVKPNLRSPTEVSTSCRFMVYLNRVEYETYTFVGKRYDRLVRDGDKWSVISREIILDQNVLLAKNLTTFF